MASPFGKARSPFADMGSSNGLGRFGSEIETPFPQPAGQKSFGFGNVSPFAAVADKESEPKNPFQQSKPFDDGSSRGSILGHASTSPFSFGISSSPFERPGGNQEKQKSPFQQPTPLGGEILAWGQSQTTAHSSTGHLGSASTSPGKASPFAFVRKEHEQKNPFQQSKAFGGAGLTSKNSQPTTGSFLLGPASTSAFSSEKSSPFASTSNDHNPFKRSAFLVGASGNSSFSFEKFSESRFGNVHKPEPKNPFDTRW